MSLHVWLSIKCSSNNSKRNHASLPIEPDCTGASPSGTHNDSTCRSFCKSTNAWQWACARTHEDIRMYLEQHSLPYKGGDYVGGDYVGGDYVGGDYVGGDYVGGDYVGGDYVGGDYVGGEDEDWGDEGGEDEGGEDDEGTGGRVLLKDYGRTKSQKRASPCLNQLDAARTWRPESRRKDPLAFGATAFNHAKSKESFGVGNSRGVQTRRAKVQQEKGKGAMTEIRKGGPKKQRR
ncbi:hypothetical protein VOLCADRAFT_88199 [Volvox carteri f. nagariensis]|uniref:Uncharacterized protein n=1 Tax=Volvox carteri f. nagariensis TaxID=3068 RepID=D8TNJ4_VOLCA|nr:uncharacterized protein VOLCADRAFT_88199 [Volvox carteri f. nagariensis]EFJ51002.1 hypothetical protein VOLCADRAFT_88199 [Volvox carteri f. nagariensis]|eukprot:XP_002948014.1 hypothetical protein VOLCADRAFT_88199 [Volvox carteri f. nagariensis]